MKGKSIVILKPVVLAFWGLLSCYCNNRLPLPHQGRSDLVTCKVNGKPWMADTTVSRNNIRLVFYQDRSLHLHAKAMDKGQENKVTSTVSFLITSVDTAGTYILGENPKNAGDYASFENSPSSFYSTDQGTTGFVCITQLDSVNRFIAGTFEFKAAAMGQSSHIVHITDGKFNMAY